MKTKSNSTYTDFGFGFPIIIDNVEIQRIDGEEFPLVNYKELERKAIAAMPAKPSRLTGNEVRFIRHHFRMTLEQFGKRLEVSHVAVKKWEASGDKAVGMQWAAEKNLRLFVARLSGVKGVRFVQLFDALECKAPSKPEALRLSLERQKPLHNNASTQTRRAAKTGPRILPNQSLG